MDLSQAAFLQIDLPAVLAALLACIANALVGNYLVLRRQSLLGDAISHAVLPGIVGGFVLMGTRATGVVFIGALVSAVVAGLLIEAVRRLGRLDPSAAMGVVFTVMFALGVLLIEQSAAHAVDLDADCVLYGQLEDIVWLAVSDWRSLFDPLVWADVPREVVTLAITTLLIAVSIIVFWKELKLTAFDPGLATALGIPAWIFHYGLVVMTAIAAIASFEAVGSILVIAMLICPAATARLLTDRLGTQVWLSIGFGASAALVGYAAAAFGPYLLFGIPQSLNAAGMIATVAGLQLGLAALLSPRHGLLSRGHRAVDAPDPPVADTVSAARSA